MTQTQIIKDKLIAMKEKVDKYDELLINYKNLENRFQKDILSLSSKLCNLKTEYLELQINYKKTYEELEQLKINNFHNEETLRDKISFFYAENDDLKAIINEQKDRLKLLNQEVLNNENVIEKHQTYISTLGYTNNSLLTSNDQYKELTIDLKIKISQSEETINNLKSENSKLVEENNKLKDLLKDNEILKSVIDELGISEWDIIDKDQEILESCIDENENKNENETGDV